MKLILKIIGGILVLALIIFLFTGLLSSKDFEGEVSETLVSTPQEIWEKISSPEQRKARLAVDDITGKDQNALGLLKWTETTNGNVSRYEVLVSSQPFLFTLALMESTQELTGLWTYTLNSNDGIHTTLTIREKSRLNDFTTRSIATLKGRNSGLRSEIRSIKRALRKDSTTAETPTQNAE